MPQGATLRGDLSSNAAGAANEIFIKQGAAPTDSVYDAAYQGGLAPNQMARSCRRPSPASITS